MSTNNNQLVVTDPVEKLQSSNPLEVVGLTPSILDLPMSREDLYDAVLAFAKQIMQKLHEDKTKNQRLSLLIVDAYKKIQDFDIFNEAVDEFRADKNAKARGANAVVDKLKADLQEARNAQKIRVRLPEDETQIKDLLVYLESYKAYIASKGHLIVHRNSNTNSIVLANPELITKMDLLTLEFDEKSKVSSIPVGEEPFAVLKVLDFWTMAHQGKIQRELLKKFNLESNHLSLDRLRGLLGTTTTNKTDPALRKDYVLIRRRSVAVNHGYASYADDPSRKFHILGSIEASKIPPNAFYLGIHYAHASLSGLLPALDQRLLVGSYIILNHATEYNGQFSSVFDQVSALKYKTQLEYLYNFSLEKPEQIRDLADGIVFPHKKTDWAEWNAKKAQLMGDLDEQMDYLEKTSNCLRVDGVILSMQNDVFTI